MRDRIALAAVRIQLWWHLRMYERDMQAYATLMKRMPARRHAIEKQMTLKAGYSMRLGLLPGQSGKTVSTPDVSVVLWTRHQQERQRAQRRSLTGRNR